MWGSSPTTSPLLILLVCISHCFSKVPEIVWLGREGVLSHSLSLKSWCYEDQLVLGAEKENLTCSVGSLPGFYSLLAAFGIPWIVDTSFPFVLLLVRDSASVLVYIQIWPLSKDTSYFEQEAYPIPSFLTNYVCNDLIDK